MPTTRLAALLLVALAALCAAGCEDKGYNQATPDDVLTTARLMVEHGDARRLADLVHADSPEMRAFLYDLGRTLDLLADLGRVVQAKFPKEVAALRAEAEQSARKGQGSSFFGRVIGMASPGRRGTLRDPAAAQEARALFDKMAMELAADPYAWLTRNQQRLRPSTEGMPDGEAVIQWDADPDADLESDWKPVLLGAIRMKEHRGLWYVVLPTQFIPMPRSPDEWEIASSILQVIDNALIDLSRDVQSGRAAGLDEVARMAGEKAFLPMAFAVMAYDRARDARREAARAAAAPPAPVPSPAEKR